MKYLNLILLSFIFVCMGCSKAKKVESFNLRMEGITVGHFDEIKKVYVFEGQELFIPLSKKSGISLTKFIGDEASLELSLYLGDEWIGDYTLHQAPTYEALRIPYDSKFDSILESGGVRLKRVQRDKTF